MKPTKHLYVIRDEYHSPLSVCGSGKTAQKQLEVLAKFTAWNRKWKIKVKKKSLSYGVIYFEDYNFVDYVMLPYHGTKKDFMKHFDFLEDYSHLKTL